MDPTTRSQPVYRRTNARVPGNGAAKPTTSRIPLDYGFREPEDRHGFCKVVGQDKEGDYDRQASDSDSEPRVKEVYKIHYPAARQQKTHYRSSTRRYSTLTCFTCGKKGHGYVACPDRVCSHCHRRGHDAPNCPSSDGEWPRNANRRGRDYVKKVDERLMDEDSASISVKVRGLVVRALLDTGAKVNVMDMQTMKELGMINHLKPGIGRVYGVGGAPITVIGAVEIPLELGDRETRWVRVHVVEGEEQALLLGRQFLRLFGRVTFDWEAGTITLGSSVIEIQEKAMGGNPIARARVIKRIDNHSLRQLIDGHQTDLNPKQHDTFVMMLKEFEGLFNDKPGRTTKCEHAIDTGNAAPCKSRPRRMPPHWEEEINTQLNELLEQGLCRPSTSPWASNVVLVTKKDGRQRFAIDYRKLNSVTKKDAYGIPQVQTILDKLHDFRFFSVIDISAAYWGVPVREGDVEKTAFNTPRGLFEMAVMPFGLVNAQATFQRLMDNSLQGLSRTESYIDDCIVYSHDFEEHIQDLRAVCDRLQQAGLHIKFKKCQFFREQVEFLGHVVSGAGRRPMPSSAEKLSKFPVPRNVTELQRFLGAVNFYRTYIPRMAQIASPLYELTRKGAAWRWSKECAQAFDALRFKLVIEPVMLAFPDWGRSFTIEADASSTGIAAVLSQRDRSSGELRPIHFFSSALSSAQRNYSAGQLEAWALVAACRKWETYLRATGEVELITDHCPLKWLRNQKDPRRTFARWILELEEYAYRIIHRPGRDNHLPDYLSRVENLPIDVEVQDESVFEDKIFTVEAGEDTSVAGSLVQAQRSDQVTSDAFGQLKNRGEVSSGQLRKVSDKLKLSPDGTLLLFQDRVVVPIDARNRVLQSVHAAGHFGQRRTLQNLRRTHFWLGMARDTRIFCQRCLVCKKAKPSNQMRVPLEEFQLEGMGPGDLVAMDIATLPWADEKFRYFLCIVDIFTRYVELVPLEDQTAATLVREFERGWVYRGHGVPRALLTDQAHNIDGVEVRNLCQKLGIEKRHSSPYHPQGDGLVERTIGLVKQVARCLTLDRHLNKEAWPEILPEVSFYCNNTENATTKFSPHFLMTGRQPLSPIDAMIAKRGSLTGSPTQYGERLQEVLAEIRSLARENDRQGKVERNEIRNKGAKLPSFMKGDTVLEKNETRKDSLDPKFKGPYLVLDIRGTNVKIRTGNKERWIHASRCKLHREFGDEVPDSSPVVNGNINTESQGEDTDVGNTSSSETENEDEPEGEGQPASDSDSVLETARRYPLRDRKAKEYKDYVLGAKGPVYRRGNVLEGSNVTFK